MRFPFRVLGSQLFYPVYRKKQLKVHRLFSPELAIVVESGDALSVRYEVRGAFIRYLCHKFYDSLFRLTIVARGQWIGRLCFC